MSLQSKLDARLSQLYDQEQRGEITSARRAELETAAREDAAGQLWWAALSSLQTPHADDAEMSS